jgi:hypothetical protein
MRSTGCSGGGAGSGGRTAEESDSATGAAGDCVPEDGAQASTSSAAGQPMRGMELPGGNRVQQRQGEWTEMRAGIVGADPEGEG